MVLTTNLSHYWKFDAGASPAVGSLTLTVSGATHTSGSGGKIGECYSYDGTNDSLYHTSPGNILNGGDFSISVWIKPDSGSTVHNRIIAQLDSANTGDWYLSYRADGESPSAAITWRRWGNTDVWTPASVITEGSWNHVVVTYDASATTVKIYVNNNLEVTNTGIGTASSTAQFHIGNWGFSDESFSGLIDEPAIWVGRILDTTDIAELWNSGNGLQYPFTATTTYNPIFYGVCF